MKHYLYILCMTLINIASYQTSYAQSIDFSLSDQDFFSAYTHKKDTTYGKSLVQHRDAFYKRFSLGVNLAGWTLTVPNLMVEFDLNETELNNRSLVLNAHYNPQIKRHTVTPKFKFDVAGVSLQFRKYWRMGKQSKNDYHEDYRLLNLKRPDTLFHKITKENEWGVYEMVKIPYFTSEDSITAKKYSGDPNRSGLYNRYHNMRRRLSGRTLENARNWRAYYLGAYVSYDKYSYCFGRRGEKGHLASIGATVGWSVPLLASSYRHQGGLDLDLGINIGLPFANYDGYKYVDRKFENGEWSEEHAHYQDVPLRSSKGWEIAPKYIVHDIHVSLVYRFRSIASKVDLALVDRYQKTIEKFDYRKDIRVNRQDSIVRAHEQKVHTEKQRMYEETDSVGWGDYMRKRYLEAMLKLNPDTTRFTPEQLRDYQRLILKMTPEAQEKALKQQKKEKKRKANQTDSTTKKDKQIRHLLEKKLKENPDTTLLSSEEMEHYKRLIMNKEKSEATKETKRNKKKESNNK